MKTLNAMRDVNDPDEWLAAHPDVSAYDAVIEWHRLRRVACGQAVDSHPFVGGNGTRPAVN